MRLGVAVLLLTLAVFAVGSQPVATQVGASASAHADLLWKRSLVIVSHTHLDPGASSDRTDYALIATSLEEFKNAGITAAVINLTIDDGDWLASGWHYIPQDNQCWVCRFQNRLNAITYYASKPENRTLIVHSVDDILAAKRTGQFGVIIGSEGTNHLVIQPDAMLEASIEGFHRQGWLVSQPFHTDGGTSVQTLGQASPCADVHRLEVPVPDTSAPICGKWFVINEAGIQVLGVMQKHGVMVDLTHVSEKSLVKIVSSADPSKPIMFSHDLQNGLPGGSPVLPKLLAYGRTSGVMGVAFLNHGGDVDNLAAYIATNRKQYRLAIGPDYAPGIQRADFGVRDAAEIRTRLLPALIARGLMDGEIADILGCNLLRAFALAWQPGAGATLAQQPLECRP